MGTAADDARDWEEEMQIDHWLHDNGKCGGDCPYCYVENLDENPDENLSGWE